MSDAYIGQILTFGGNFAPYGWLACDGSQQPISQYNGLAALLGTTFGGDGSSTFGLPDLRGGAMLHQGQLSGGRTYPFAGSGGAASVTLNAGQLPVHGHAVNVIPTPASPTATPGSSTLIADAGSGAEMYASGTPNTALAAGSVTATGGSAPHPNLQPVLGIITCICWNGVYPTPASPSA